MFDVCKIITAALLIVLLTCETADAFGRRCRQCQPSCQPSLVVVLEDCQTVGAKDGKVEVKVFGFTVSVPVTGVPDGTLVSVCSKACKQHGIICGVQCEAKVGPNVVGSAKVGCCN
jgi:hypothetical protein